jgi:hypothetical protein
LAPKAPRGIQRMKNIFKNKNIYFFCLIVFVTLFTFYNLPNTFYQKDEWQTLGHNLAEGIGIFTNVNPLSLFFGEIRPLSGLIYLIFLGFYKFSIIPTAIFGIVFQIINAILTFYLTDKITKNKFIALLASLFLITNSVSHQAVTWASAAIGTLPATTLVLLTIIFYLKYFVKEKKKYLIFCLIATILSLLFKGVGLFLFILLPLMFFIYKIKSINKKNITKALKTNSLLFGLGILMVLVRFGQFFLRTENVAGQANLAGNHKIFILIFLRAIFYPLTSLSQIFIPPLDLYSVTIPFAKMQYKFLVGSPLTDLVAQSIVADMFAIVGSFLILGFLIFMAYKYKNKIINRNIIFALLFLFLSFLPYVVLNRDSSYLSSRYFYVGVVPAGIIFGYLIYFLSNIHKYLKWPIFLLVILFFFHHANIIRGDINYQVKLGNERKAILNGIRNLYPASGRDSIFYVTSDKQYSGAITNPFQSGLGYVLEVWYYDSGNVPKEFLKENFLWDLGTEGYKKSGEFGFGYFQNIDKMAKEMKEKKLSINIIHGFFIDSETQQVSDITNEIRAKIATISGIPK